MTGAVVKLPGQASYLGQCQTFLHGLQVDIYRKRGHKSTIRINLLYVSELVWNLLESMSEMLWLEERKIELFEKKHSGTGLA